MSWLFGSKGSASAEEAQPLKEESQAPAKVEAKAGATARSPEEEAAGHTGHSLTDIPCCVIFLLALGGLGYVLNYAKENGDMRRVYNGFNFQGQLCGRDKPDKTFLFWCQKPVFAGGSPTVPILDMQHPICVESCPTSALTTHSCFQMAAAGPMTPTGDKAGSFVQTTQYEFALVQDYPTSEFANRYCMPQSDEAMASLTEELAKHPTGQAMLKISNLGRAWRMFSIAGAAAFVISYMYLFLLDKFAGVLVWAGLCFLMITPTAVGGLFVYLSLGPGIDGVEGTGDSQHDQMIGGVLIAVGLLISVCVCCIRSSINMAVGCVQAACECMMDMVAMPLFVPLFAMILKIIIMSIMFFGFLWLVSCGRVMPKSLQEYVAVEGANISGLTRSFTYTGDQKNMLLFYFFMILWVDETLNAISQFVLAYATSIWYFCPVNADGSKEGKPKLCGIFTLTKGFFYCIIYHLGTVAFGAFLVAALRLARYILSYVAKQAQAGGNPAAQCLASACACCLKCFEEIVRFMNKNAYIDCAINSNSFLTAAKDAFEILTSNAGAVAILNGATFVFQLAGVGAVSAGGGTLCYMLATKVSYWNDPTREHYIEDPALVAAFATGISFLVSFTFMLVFDMVADTMLFCHASNAKRNPNCSIKYGTKKLDELLSKAM